MARRTLRISDLVDLPRPEPWADHDNIPWNEPEFSERMLREHLSQAHDSASRRTEIIDAHIAWIHGHALPGRPGRVLDLGCGPGLYTSRLARLGHDCVGIDFSPASIAYAREEARVDRLTCEYRLGDVRTTDFGEAYDLVMMISGELNVFGPDDARAVLTKARCALVDGGLLLLEAHTFQAVRQMARRPRSWQALPQGLFSDRPHLPLQEQWWDEATRTMTRRFLIVDAGTGSVDAFGQTLQAYEDNDYRALLGSCGFGTAETHASLSGQEVGDGDFWVMIAGLK